MKNTADAAAEVLHETLGPQAVQTLHMPQSFPTPTRVDTRVVCKSFKVKFHQFKTSLYPWL